VGRGLVSRLPEKWRNVGLVDRAFGANSGAGKRFRGVSVGSLKVQYWSHRRRLGKKGIYPYYQHNLECIVTVSQNLQSGPGQGGSHHKKGLHSRAWRREY